VISREEVEHMARLARLRLEETEVESLQDELSRVMEYVGCLRELDLAGVPVTVNAVNVSNIFRPDDEGPCLSREEVFANAPAVERGHFLVPRIG